MQVVAGLIAVVLACALAADTKPATADERLQLSAVTALAYSPDGRLLAAGDDVRRVAVFRAEDGEALPMLTGLKLQGRILALRFTPDGMRLLVATESGLQAFDTRLGAETASVRFSTPAAALSADGRKVAIVTGDDVQVLEAETGKRLATLQTGLGFPATLAFGPGARVLAIGAQETMMTLGGPAPQGVPSGSLEIFDLESGKRKIFRALSPWFSAICFSPDGSEVAAVTFGHAPGAPINDYTDTVLTVWDARSGKTMLEAPLPNNSSYVDGLFFAHGTSTVVGTSEASWGGDILVAEIASGRLSHAGPFDIPSIFASTLAPSENMLATGVTRRVEIREVPSGRLVATLGATGGGKP